MTNMADRRFRAVIFDLFGTLVPNFPSGRFKESLEAMAQAVGIEPDVFRRLWIKDTALERFTGKLPTIAANVRRICDLAGSTVTDKQVKEAVNLRHEFTRGVLDPRPDAVGTLLELKTASLCRGLISDCTPEVPDLWSSTPFAPLIDVPIFSCAVGLKKPDPRIYHLACERLRVKPAECLYIGDGSSHELEGAKNVGMTSILLAPIGEFTETAPSSEAKTWTGMRIGKLRDLTTLMRN
jgi:putative hydrolase of the HAD superfamily